MYLEHQATNTFVDDPAAQIFPLDTATFKILQINIRGMNQFEKLDSFCVFLQELRTTIDVIIIGET